MTAQPPAPVARIRRAAWRGGRAALGERAVPEETAIALTYNRASYAVMMASPVDLEDFAVGFSLAEGIIGDRREILDLEIVPMADGIELRMEITPARDDAFLERHAIDLVVHGDDKPDEGRAYWYGAPIARGIFAVVPYTREIDGSAISTSELIRRAGELAEP